MAIERQIDRAKFTTCDFQLVVNLKQFLACTYHCQNDEEVV